MAGKLSPSRPVARRKPTAPPPPVRGAPTIPPPKRPTAPKPPAKKATFVAPKRQTTPGIVDHPKDYQRRHPNAVLKPVKGGGARVVGQRTKSGIRAKMPTLKMPKPPTIRRMY